MCYENAAVQIECGVRGWAVNHAWIYGLHSFLAHLGSLELPDHFFFYVVIGKALGPVYNYYINANA